MFSFFVEVGGVLRGCFDEYVFFLQCNVFVLDKGYIVFWESVFFFEVGGGFFNGFCSPEEGGVGTNFGGLDEGGGGCSYFFFYSFFLGGKKE